MAEPLRYSGVHIEHPGARARSAGETSRVWIGAVTPAGHMREIPLERAQLITLIADAARFLAILEREPRASV